MPRWTTYLPAVASCIAAAFLSTARAQAPGVAVDLLGTTLRASLSDGRVIEGKGLTGATLTVAVGGRGLRVKIAAVEPDPRDPDLLLYDFRVVTPAGETPMCEPDPDGRPLGLPLSGRSTPAGVIEADPGHFELVCTASPQAKCVRFGYGGWKKAPDGRPMLDWFNACVRLMRGDYCGDGAPHTRNGTWIDLFDTLGVQKSDEDPTLSFEAGWNAQGAVCVARPRVPDLLSPERLAAICPRLKDRIGNACTQESARRDGALIFNRSRAP